MQIEEYHCNDFQIK